MNADPSTDDPRLLHATQEYLAELEAGHRPERTAFTARFPEIRAALEPYLDALDLFHGAGPLAEAVSPATHDQTLPAEPLGDFRIVKRIGHGGMGTVYEAVQLSLGRRVALKVLPFAAALDAKQLQRFKNEAQAAAQLHHTNIVPVHAVGCERGVHYYAMQLIEGLNLAELIRQLRPAEHPESVNDLAVARSTSPSTAGAVAVELSTQRATHSGGYYRNLARLAIQAADALEHAHQLGVIHRDVKPANLLVDDRGNLWITDFGLAQFQTGAGLTRTGDLLGTLRYMSPEQASGQGTAVDVRTDVYSLGATLYELLTLRPMFDAANHQHLLHHILNTEPWAPRAIERAIPAELETIVLKAVSKSPGDRYQTARDFADDLRRFVDNRPILARRPSLPQRVRKWRQRHPSLVAAGILLLLVVAAGSLVSAALVRSAYERERQRAEDAETQFRLAQKAVHEMIQISDEELAGNPLLQAARRRLLESALVYFQEFIDRRQDDPAAQDELRETRARVQKILADLAMLQTARPTPMLRDKAVMDALQLDDEQRRRIRDMLDAGMKSMLQWGKLPPAERERLFADLIRSEDAVVKGVLRPEQDQRLKQIAYQVQGLAAFRDPTVIAALKLTDEQAKRIRAIEAETFFGLPGTPGPPPHGKGPKDDFRKDDFRKDDFRKDDFRKDDFRKDDFRKDDFRKGIDQKQKAARERALAVLTTEQQATWRELIGPPFAGAMRFQGPFGPKYGPPGPPP
jgi:serine/threonine protein kinase